VAIPHVSSKSRQFGDKRWGRWGWPRFWRELMELGAFTEEEAMDTATQMLYRNATQLYGV